MSTCMRARAILMRSSLPVPVGRVARRPSEHLHASARHPDAVEIARLTEPRERVENEEGNQLMRRAISMQSG